VLFDMYGTLCLPVEVESEIPAVHYVRMTGDETLLTNAVSRPIPLYGPALLVGAKERVNDQKPW